MDISFAIALQKGLLTVYALTALAVAINEESPQLTAYVQQIGEFYEVLKGEKKLQKFNDAQKKLIRSIVNKLDKKDKIFPPDLRGNLQYNVVLDPDWELILN